MKPILHEIVHTKLGTSALVTGTDGIKLWRNRDINREPFTIESPFNEFNNMQEFNIWVKSRPILVTYLNKINYDYEYKSNVSDKVPAITNIMGTFIIMIPITIISYFIFKLFGLL